MSTLDARDNLNHIARHWPDLQHQLGGLKSTPTDKITVQTSGDPQAPINLHVLDLLDEIRSWAWWAVSQLETHAGITHDLGFSDTAALRHLATHHEAWDGIDDFLHATQRYRRKTDQALRNTNPQRHLGPCTTPDCDGEIYAQDNTTSGTCPRCGNTWTPNGQYAWLKDQAETVLLTRPEIVTALKRLGHDTPYRTIQTWINRGKLKPQEEDLYRLEDAITLAGRKK
ncbi:MAG: hypothetical protein K0S70_193 [Microbacterium sp.]|nr:hypothetical protein [Microbacterium sp.]